jgi:F-type H+-transporting ATPase subunit b
VKAIIPNLAEFIPALISFAIVFFVLAKFAWPAISSMLDQRADNIRESLERAENAKVEAERLLEEYKHTMAEARKEAGTILQQAKQSAEATRSEAAAKAQADYDDLLVKAREAIDGEKRAAIAELQRSVADLSVAVAGRLIGAELSTEDHLKVIEKYVSEAGSLNAN